MVTAVLQWDGEGGGEERFDPCFLPSQLLANQEPPQVLQIISGYFLGRLAFIKWAEWADCRATEHQQV